MHAVLQLEHVDDVEHVANKEYEEHVELERQTRRVPPQNCRTPARALADCFQPL